MLPRPCCSHPFVPRSISLLDTHPSHHRASGSSGTCSRAGKRNAGGQQRARGPGGTGTARSGSQQQGGAPGSAGQGGPAGRAAGHPWQVLRDQGREPWPATALFDCPWEVAVHNCHRWTTQRLARGAAGAAGADAGGEQALRRSAAHCPSLHCALCLLLCRTSTLTRLSPQSTSPLCHPRFAQSSSSPWLLADRA